MKYQRQAKILELVEKYDIETQDDLLEKLKEEGFQATQATVSRDIREMNLTKVSVPGARQKYAVEKNNRYETLDSYKKVLSTGIISVDAAENLIVIKTISGVAMAVAAALDHMAIDGLMGCIAGDDTIFLAVKDKNLTMSIKAQIEKMYGKGSIMRLGDAAGQTEIEVIPTGCLTLDLALGIGGMPRGRIIEIYGPESSGKTTLALHIVAQAQKRGGEVAFVDAEHALDPDYAARIGVDIDSMLVSQPDTGEQALEITDALVRSGAVDVVVLTLSQR